MPRTLHPIRPVAALALLSALAACTHSTNDTLRLGESDILSSFTIEPHTLPPVNPGVTSLSRDNWDTLTLLVPVNGTAHQPTHAPSALDLDTLARQRGEYPTAESSLELGEPDITHEISLATQTHGFAFLDALLLVPRAILRPPTATDWSPTISYGRAPLVDITAPSCGPDGGGCCQTAPVCDEASADEAPTCEESVLEPVEETTPNAVESGPITE